LSRGEDFVDEAFGVVWVHGEGVFAEPGPTPSTPAMTSGVSRLHGRDSGRLMQYFDVAGWAGGSGQPAVPGEQEYLQRLGKRYVGGVVDAQIAAQFPAAGQQGPVRCSPEGKRAQVSQCQCCPPCVHGTSPDLPPPDRHNLKVHQLGRGQPFPAQSGTCLITVRAVITKTGRQDAGINDDHDRSAAPPRLPSAAQNHRSGLPRGRGPHRG
jgi:hypothetical protein